MRLSDGINNPEGEEPEEDETSRKGLPEKKKRKLLDPDTWIHDGRLVEIGNSLRSEIGGELFEDHNVFKDKVDAVLKNKDIKLSASDLKTILRAVSWRDESAAPVIAKVYKEGKSEPSSLYGRYEFEDTGGRRVVEYEPDTEIRDTEQIPLLEPGGIEEFFKREVLPYTPDAWVKEGSTKIGYEISFTRYFYKPQPMRSLMEIHKDVLAAERKAADLLGELFNEEFE